MIKLQRAQTEQTHSKYAKSDATGDVEKGFEEDDKTPLSNR